MMRRIVALAALVAGGFIPVAAAKDALIKRLPVKPDTCYRLSFKAKTPAREAAWLIRVFNRQGELPYDGCYERAWQRITPGKVSYAHLFRTNSDAATLWFGIRSEGAQPEISEVKLEEITPAALLVNGDFSAGKDNYSGWTEHYNTVFVVEKGKPALKVEHNGYVLTDPAPVAGGGEYRYAPKSFSATSILAYDSDMHLIGIVPYKRRLAVIKMPADAAYVRLLYQTWWDHIPAYRTRTISAVGLVQTDGKRREIKADVPRFPGEIILDSGCDPREERAARELQYWIRQITGKRIPVLAAASASPNTKIYLGAKWASKYADDLKYLAGSDGYAVRRDGNNIHVFGADPRGTLFGVYRLLEKNTDIIWPRPNPEFSAVFSKVSDIQFTHSDFRSRPAFKFRALSISGSDRNKAQSQAWRGRNGVNTPMMLGKGFQYLRWRNGALIGAGGGFIGAFMGLKQDEDLYPLIAGNRWRSVWRQPCYTNPEVPKVIANKAREMLASVPGKKVEYLIARIGDNWDVCACPNCMAPIKLADGTLLKPKATSSTRDPLFFSTRNFMMLNKVAEELAGEYPDLKIHTHAYIFAAEPPKVKLHPAIVPHFAAYPTKNERYPILSQPPGRGEIWGRRFRQWGKEQSVQFGFFGYYYTHGFNAMADTAAADYRALAEMGGIHVHTEGCWADTDALSAWDVDGPEKWVIARLMWDPYQNPAALRDEYIKRTYRGAAPKMREFYRLISDSWHDKANKTFVNCHTAANDLFEAFIVRPGIEKRARKLLEEASKAATNPTSRKMIRRTLAQFDAYAAALNRIFIPLVPEATNEWSNHESPHWYKAVSIGDFTRVADWRPLPKDKLAKHKTKVSMMRDKENIYFKVDAVVEKPLPPRLISRIDAFPRDDRVEIVLRSGRTTYYFAVGVDGGTYCLKNWYPSASLKNSVRIKYLSLDKSWTALIAVPMSALELNREAPDLDGKFCRVFAPKSPDREESTYNGRGIFRSHKLLRTPLLFEK